MSDNFAKLFEESLSQVNMKTGAIIKGKVIAVNDDFVTINAGLKSEGIIPVEQFKNDQGNLEINVGDTVDVALDAIEDGYGETRLSREKAKRFEAWQELEKAYEEKKTVIGVISGRVKGGFTVEIDSVRAFLPGSLIDSRPVKDSTPYEGKELEFKIIKVDQKRNNIVVSRRSLNEPDNSEIREKLLSELEEGQKVRGVIKNLTDYGAFVDLGGLDGLLHITDMAWKRIKHPSEVINVGDEIEVKVLKFDKEKNRVSLGLKQLSSDPWSIIQSTYPIGAKVKGVVTNVTDYGCFVELEPGVEGLVHVSEMDWTNKNVHPSKIVQPSQKVDVIVLEIDEDRRRISLGIKQCADNPWQAFDARHQKGEVITGRIKSITDFGIFVGLDGDIDGLVHVSDISWNAVDEEAIREFKKGQEIKTVLLSVDPERERISLGIKQLEQDKFGNFANEHAKGSVVKGKVVEVTAKLVRLQLEDGIEGTIKAGEIARERVEDARNHVQEGDEIEAKIVSIDRKTRSVSLSVKAKESQDEAQALKDFNSSQSSNTAVTSSLGDLLKEKMKNTKSDE
ncbi:MAG: 30S ribosomal protein S1 [Gammaproteobacteria bacterium]|nr:30S ribosomal protein S1 [Gammaproteobacteria bacterium]